jgi:hypothetical protein
MDEPRNDGELGRRRPTAVPQREEKSPVLHVT